MFDNQKCLLVAVTAYLKEHFPDCPHSNSEQNAKRVLARLCAEIFCTAHVRANTRAKQKTEVGPIIQAAKQMAPSFFNDWEPGDWEEILSHLQAPETIHEDAPGKFAAIGVVAVQSDGQSFFGVPGSLSIRRITGTLGGKPSACPLPLRRHPALRLLPTDFEFQCGLDYAADWAWNRRDRRRFSEWAATEYLQWDIALNHGGHLTHARGRSLSAAAAMSFIAVA